MVLRMAIEIVKKKQSEDPLVHHHVEKEEFIFSTSIQFMSGRAFIILPIFLCNIYFGNVIVFS
jgi:hypothetical protein